MDTPPRSARFWTRLPAAVGLALTAAAADAQTPEPAARLRPPVPITLPDSPLLTRGQTPDARPFDPTRGPTPPMVTSDVRPASAWPGSTYSSLPKTAIGTTRAPWDAPRQPSVLENTWADVKEFFSGKPAETTVAPRPPSTLARPTAVQQPPMPQPAMPQIPTSGVYAGPPAYRWYGWGTTTPGANPYAPGGQYPRGSGNWYAQTGATPGAFPVPVSAPRFVFGAEPPSYVGVTNTTGLPTEPAGRQPARLGSTPNRGPIVTEQPTSPISVQPPTGGDGVPLTTIPVPPQGSPEPRAFDATPTDPTPVVPAGQPAPLTVIPSSAVTEPVPADGVSWQRAGEPLPVTPVGEKRNFAPASVWSPAQQSGVPLKVQQASAAVKMSPAEAAVRGACQGSASVTKFRVTAPNCLLVEVTAATQADARAAFEKVSQHPLLKPYEVQFEVKLTGR